MSENVTTEEPKCGARLTVSQSGEDGYKIFQCGRSPHGRDTDHITLTGVGLIDTVSWTTDVMITGGRTGEVCTIDRHADKIFIRQDATERAVEILDVILREMQINEGEPIGFMLTVARRIEHYVLTGEIKDDKMGRVNKP